MMEYNYNKELASKLTILLPLKGRPLFTLRYFLYMEAVRCPFKILVADGSLDEENKKIIDENKHKFQNVNFEYNRFPPDNTILDFEKKMADALAMIKTPYVMWNSNDDFYVIETILKNIDFLENDIKQEYVACGGEFYKYLSLKNEIKFIKKINYCTAFFNFEQNSPLERIVDQIPYKGACATYGAIRTKTFEQVYNKIVCLKISDLKVSEYFAIRLFLVNGKIKQLPDVNVFWQCSSSSSASSQKQKENKKEQSIVIEFLCNELSEKENLSHDQIYKKISSKFSLNRHDLLFLLMSNSKIIYCIVGIKKLFEKVLYSLLPSLVLKKIVLLKYKNCHDVINFYRTFFQLPLKK